MHGFIVPLCYSPPCHPFPTTTHLLVELIKFNILSVSWCDFHSFFRQVLLLEWHTFRSLFELCCSIQNNYICPTLLLEYKKCLCMWCVCTSSADIPVKALSVVFPFLSHPHPPFPTTLFQLYACPQMCVCVGTLIVFEYFLNSQKKVNY